MLFLNRSILCVIFLKHFQNLLFYKPVKIVFAILSGRFRHLHKAHMIWRHVKPSTKMAESNWLINRYSMICYYSRFVDNQLLPSSTDDESDTHSLTNGPAASFRQRQTQQHVSVSQENLANFGRKRLGKGVRKTRRIDNCMFIFIKYSITIKLI